MKRDLICVTEGEKLYAIRTKTMVKDTSKIETAKTYKDILEMLLEQNINYTVNEIEGEHSAISTFIVGGFDYPVCERNIYIKNNLQKSCKLTFSGRVIHDNAMKYGNVIVRVSSVENKKELELFCKKDSYRHFKLEKRIIKDLSFLEYKVVI